MTRASDTARILSGGAVINEDSHDVDFRVESNGNANMLFVDGGNDRVGIGAVAGSGNGLAVTNTDGGSALVMHRDFSGSDVSSNTTAATIDFTLSDSATSNQTLCKISPQASVGTGDAFGGILRFFTSNDSGSTTERLRLMANGRLENQSPTNSGNVLQDFRIDFRNENNAGIMAGIGCVRTANANAPGAFVIRTSTDVDSSSNSSDGEISEKFRVAANGDLTATDTSISSNSDSRLKENISDFSYDLDKFKALKTKTFDWKNPKLHGEKSGQRGFIAQDIETVDDYWIEEIEVPADSDDFQYLEDKDIFYTENSTIPDGKKVGDLEYKARFAKTSKLGQKDAMYVSVIQQLIKRIEALESK
jgi:prepilin-type processing-associated H-X9-DG protein